jgi:hypothetical protein
MPWPAADWANLKTDFEIAYNDVPGEERQRDWAIYNLLEARTGSVDRADELYGMMLGRLEGVRTTTTRLWPGSCGLTQRIEAPGANSLFLLLRFAAKYGGY